MDIRPVRSPPVALPVLAYANVPIQMLKCCLGWLTGMLVGTSCVDRLYSAHVALIRGSKGITGHSHCHLLRTYSCAWHYSKFLAALAHSILTTALKGVAIICFTVKETGTWGATCSWFQAYPWWRPDMNPGIWLQVSLCYPCHFPQVSTHR